MRSARRLVFPLAFAFLALFSHPSVYSAPVLKDYGRIPLGFIENNGQLDSRVAFSTQLSGCNIFFTAEGATFVITRETPASVARRTRPAASLASVAPEIERKRIVFTQKFANSRRNPTISGEERLPWDSNYFIGNDPAKWRTHVPNYRKIRISEVYDGVDLVYYGNRAESSMILW